MTQLRCPVCKSKDVYFYDKYIMIQHFFQDHDRVTVAIELAEIIDKYVKRLD